MKGAVAPVAVAVSNLQRRARVSPARLRATARRALAALGRTDREVHVTVVDDRRIRALNARYLGTRRATDVLAFELAAPGAERLWGEVIVSAETAARQARRLGVPLAAELDLLVVHGLLHLAGYDDHEPRRARRMHRRARQILGPSRGRLARLWTGLLEEA
ncbi:MAG TPA: rRNA maturation RNase YbeY [Candidatus Bathyarchaeia archaeon]|nr:rRNA maturation RNase YbeY [Candidatus Bathyarchaeia archaeon]